MNNKLTILQEGVSDGDQDWPLDDDQLFAVAAESAQARGMRER